ncbi:unnamed protein product [Cuscuta epithymum]|uniref:YTH domain-containing family protein n=2 Tax=Cuscuta epithymum TaxID=186058 RepID=A0AAV0EWJ1_9ASTE|nr:unnamed protein product [Cuscuta epithymum]
MDAVGPPPDRTTEELLQILTLDVDSEKAHQVQECTKKNKLLEISALPFYQDSTGPTMFCNSNRYQSPTYYYGGYDGSTASKWDRYVMPGGAEVPPNMYDNYQTGYSYAPYETYSPSCSNVGHDSKPQQYPYPTRHVQPSSTNNGTYSWNQPTDVHSKVISSIVSSQLLFPGETKGNKYYNSTGLVNRTNIMKPVRHSYQHSLLKSPDAYGWGNKSAAPHWSSSPAAQISNFHSRESQNLQHPRHVMGLQHQRVPAGVGGGYTNQMNPNNGLGFKSESYGVRLGAHDCVAIHNADRSHGHSIVLSSDNTESASSISLNRGPRAKGVRGQKDSEAIILAVKERILNTVKGNNVNDNEPLPLSPGRGQYNRDDFPETFSAAKFFVVKSYSEDDVHKSVKYGVWASTPNGNKKLDEAYREAQKKPGGCPVFLLFSVNASGQFVGLAEMVGPVDYDKTVEYWQQDKWNGCFHVKWHIVKDVPNSMLRHIRLENNENKPVTNSRDTQEVGLEQGNQILKIFKEHFSKTCILDDIDFYEGRQKMMHEKKAKQLLSSNKQDGNVKPAVVVSAQKVVGEIDTEGFTSLNGGVKRREQQRSFAAVLISHDNKSHKTA